MTIARLFCGKEWPLLEFQSDKVAPLRKVIDEFTEPFMEDAIAKWNFVLSKGTDTNDDDKNENLLEHLVKHTQDNRSPLRLHFNCLMRFWML